MVVLMLVAMIVLVLVVLFVIVMMPVLAARAYLAGDLAAILNRHGDHKRRPAKVCADRLGVVTHKADGLFCHGEPFLVMIQHDTGLDAIQAPALRQRVHSG